MNKKQLFPLVIFLICGFTAFGQKQLVILHTNDTHSRIEPLPNTDKTAPDKGGVVRRATFIDSVRHADKNVLLLDAGDFLQGTPYFNLFKGKVEVEAMNRMKYDVATIGNHEFDYGLETLAEVARQARFPIICCNYDFSGTPMEGLTKPYVIFKKNGIRIGVIGVGVQPQGLVGSGNYKGMKYLPPEKIVNDLALRLKEKNKCDMVICLTHIGYMEDIDLAKNTRNVDLIIGGHSHTYMKEPEWVKNLDDKEVMIHQTNGRGVYVGEIKVDFEKKKNE
ncbi:MAG: metallophosphatase [Dysgonamonadaceae bacterium]|jgi:5'-nucleotidase|nr:metallophosphatase [Dysgonamonadaceae bacterium]